MRLWHFPCIFSCSCLQKVVDSVICPENEKGSTTLRQVWRFAGGVWREPLSLLSVLRSVPPCRDCCGGRCPPALPGATQHPDRPRCRELSASALLLSPSGTWRSDRATMVRSPRKLIQVCRAMTMPPGRWATRSPSSAPQRLRRGRLRLHQAGRQHPRAPNRSPLVTQKVGRNTRTLTHHTQGPATRRLGGWMPEVRPPPSRSCDPGRHHLCPPTPKAARI